MWRVMCYQMWKSNIGMTMIGEKSRQGLVLIINPTFKALKLRILQDKECSRLGKASRYVLANVARQIQRAFFREYPELRI